MANSSCVATRPTCSSVPRLNGDLHASIQELTVEVAVLKTRLKSSELALEIQSREYERRLEELNHSHQAAVVDRAQYVTRELHDQLNQELLGKIEALRKESQNFICHKDFDRLAEQVKVNTERFGTDIATLSTKNATLAAAGAAILALMNLVFVIWHTIHG